MSKAYVYEVALRYPNDPHWKPEGWDPEKAEQHPRFASWRRDGDNVTEPMIESLAIDRDGLPWFSPPQRRRFFSRCSAMALANEAASIGVQVDVMRSEVGEPEPVVSLRNGQPGVTCADLPR